MHICARPEIKLAFSLFCSYYACQLLSNQTATSHVQYTFSPSHYHAHHNPQIPRNPPKARTISFHFISKQHHKRSSTAPRHYPSNSTQNPQYLRISHPPPTIQNSGRCVLKPKRGDSHALWACMEDMRVMLRS